MVAIFQGYQASLDRLRHLQIRLSAMNWLNNQMVLIERGLQAERRLPMAVRPQESITVGRSDIDLNSEFQLSEVDDHIDVFKVTLTLDWQASGRRSHLHKTAYIWDPIPDQAPNP
jgi:hypothetical protein